LKMKLRKLLYLGFYIRKPNYYYSVVFNEKP
jgi:hypothetical protein